MSIGEIANWASVVCALLAAVSWARVALEKTPEHVASTADQTNFDWLTIPLTRQAIHNKWGASFAGLTAVLQGIAAAWRG